MSPLLRCENYRNQLVFAPFYQTTLQADARAIEGQNSGNRSHESPVFEWVRPTALAHDDFVNASLTRMIQTADAARIIYAHNDDAAGENAAICQFDCVRQSANYRR